MASKKLGEIATHKAYLGVARRQVDVNRERSSSTSAPDATPRRSRSLRVIRKGTDKGTDEQSKSELELTRRSQSLRAVRPRHEDTEEKLTKSTSELTGRSQSPRTIISRRHGKEAVGTERKAKTSERTLGRSRSLRIAQNAIDDFDEKENVSKSDTQITTIITPGMEERYSAYDLKRAIEPGTLTTSDESGMFDDYETLDTVSSRERTFLRTPTVSSRRQESPDSFREARSTHSSIRMVPRFPEGLDFWKPPGTGSLFAKLYESWTKESAVSPAEAEDNSGRMMMFRSAASLLFRKGFRAAVQNETPGPGYYNPCMGERLRFPRMPSFTIRRKIKCPDKEPTPG